MSKLSLALLATVLALVVASPAAAAVSIGTPVLDAEEQSFCAQINKHRAKNGIAPLRMSVSLVRAAEWMSRDLAANNYFTHTDSLGRVFSTRLAAFGYSFFTPKAETIAAGRATAYETFEQWRNSSGHNAAMLNPAYTVFGIGRSYNAAATYRWYWTADFGGYADRTIAC